MAENYPLFVRFGNEWHNPSEFIRPHDGMVEVAVEEIAAGAGSQDEAVCLLWDWVCREIRYPLTLFGESTDYHLLKAFPVSESLFGTRYLVNYANDEFFQYPSETLAWQVADCDGTSILLGSMLLNVLPREQVKVVVGSTQESESEADHAWVYAMLGGEMRVLETTLTSIPANYGVRARQVGIGARGEGYLPFIEFDDEGLTERIPLVLNHANEVAKLRRISNLWGWPTKVPGG